MIQQLIVIVLFIGAALYLFNFFKAMTKKDTGCKSGCACADTHQNRLNNHPPTI